MAARIWGHIFTSCNERDLYQILKFFLSKYFFEMVFKNELSWLEK